MSRAGFIVTAAAAAMGGALAGCSGLSFGASDWLKPKAAAQMQTLQFQSEPTGTEVRTAQGQTCQTPCSLAVVAENQSVTFAKTGFISQTVQISVSAPAEHSLFAKNKPPTLMPNPVGVALKAVPPEPVPPPKPVAREEPAPAAKHYWPASAPMAAPQPEASPSPSPLSQ
ncbi:MAG: hypothetical protein ACLPX7_16200 [Xanthobacteraceae bacterium]